MATTLRPAGLEDQSGWAILDPQCVRHRVWLVAGVLALLFLGLLARLWYLQIAQGAAFLAQAERNRVRRVPLPAPRGLILDRHGDVLATSRAFHSIAVVPAALPSRKKEAKRREQVLRTLSYLLKTTPPEIEKRLAEARRLKGNAYDPVRVAERVDIKTITLIEENKPRLGPAVLVTDEITRFYPRGALAAHVLGYTGVVTKEDLDRSKTKENPPGVRRLRYDDVLGKSGIEAQYDALLAGTPGSALYEVDARLQPVRRLNTVPEKAGHTLTLTLDEKLQRAAEEALGNARNSGAVAVIDVRDGGVLALASRPTFDPNIFSLGRRDFNRAYRQIVANTKHPLINRAVSSRFPPGSTFKMVTAAAALEKGISRPHSPHYFCSGGLRLGRFFGCWSTHGSVDLMRALADSCDVYFYQSALRLGNPEGSGPTYLAKMARSFGLGRPTGIDLPTDGAGLVPDPDWRTRYHRKRPALARWYPGNTLNMSIGQGDVLATPLQMALVTAAVANGGGVWRPHILQAVRDGNGKVVQKFQPSKTQTAASAANLAIVRAGMRLVVTAGTGKSIALPQVAVAGKTGSAEDDNHGLPHAWWVCFAPYDKPRIAIAVIVENSGHGSANAVPVAKRILEAAFPKTANR